MENYKAEFNKRIYKYALDIVKVVGKLPKDTAMHVLAKKPLNY